MLTSDDPKLKAYLDLVCKKIRNKKTREEVRAELMDHFEQALSEGRSVDSVIEEFGKPELMGGSLAEVHRPIFLTVPFACAFISLSLMIGVIVVSELVKYKNRQLTEYVTNIVDTHRIRFLEDQKTISDESFFDIPGKLHDAGVFLNPRIKWEGRLDPPFDFLRANPGFKIPSGVPGKLSQAGRQWAELYTLGWDQGVDLKWMSELSPYDHWDWVDWAPMKHALSDMRLTPSWTLPGPDTIGLLEAAKIRLLRGLRTRDPIPAFREVRQLGKLIYSSETGIGAIVGMSVLYFEREAYELAVKQNMIKPSDWHPLSEDQYIRARRSMHAYPEFFQVGSPFEDVGILAKGKVAKAGYCSALAQSANAILMLKNRLGDTRFPLETDFSSEIAKVLNLVRDPANPCRLNYFKLLDANSSVIQYWFANYPAPTFFISNVKKSDLENWFLILKTQISFHLPWIRQLDALNYQKLAYPDYMTGTYRTDLLPEERELLQGK